VRLGKKAGTVHDRRTLQLRDFIVAQPVPKTWRIASAVHDWGMYGNDEYGDCGLASLGGHRVIAQENSARQREARPTTQQILDAYFGVTGGADTGIYLIDGLKYVRKVGVGRETDGTPHTITAFARVNQHDRDELKVAARMFGGVYLGLALPLSARREINAGQPWIGTSDPLYSWGGHAVWMIGFDSFGPTCVTWGREQRMSWDWFATYCDEAWCVVSEDFFLSSGKTPQGFDVQALQDALGRL
jgi:hypothetical protein